MKLIPKYLHPWSLLNLINLNLFKPTKLDINKKYILEADLFINSLHPDIKKNIDKLVSDYTTESNDNTKVNNVLHRLYNLHLKQRTIAGAKSNALWEKEHPTLSTLGYTATAAPFVVASAPALIPAGDALAGSAVGNGISSILTNPYFNAVITASGGADAANKIYHGEYGKSPVQDAFTTMEIIPFIGAAPKVIKGVTDVGKPLLDFTSLLYKPLRDYRLSKIINNASLKFNGTVKEPYFKSPFNLYRKIEYPEILDSLNLEIGLHPTLSWQDSKRIANSVPKFENVYSPNTHYSIKYPSKFSLKPEEGQLLYSDLIDKYYTNRGLLREDLNSLRNYELIIDKRLNGKEPVPEHIAQLSYLKMKDLLNSNIYKDRLLADGMSESELNNFIREQLSTINTNNIYYAGKNNFLGSSIGTWNGRNINISDNPKGEHNPLAVDVILHEMGHEIDDKLGYTFDTVYPNKHIYKSAVDVHDAVSYPMDILPEYNKSYYGIPTEKRTRALGALNYIREHNITPEEFFKLDKLDKYASRYDDAKDFRFIYEPNQALNYLKHFKSIIPVGIGLGATSLYKKKQGGKLIPKGHIKIIN